MIKVGDKIPSAKLMHMTKDGPRPITTEELFGGKKVVLFALPGAFTPTCSAKHLPGFVKNAEVLRKKGVDSIAYLSVNDAFVMGAWGKDQKVGDKVMMLADGNAEFTRAVGLESDASGYGMGVRSKRYASYHYPHYNLGRVYMAQDQLNDARRCFQRALELEPGYTLAREALEQVPDVRGGLERTARTAGCSAFARLGVGIAIGIGIDSDRSGLGRDLPRFRYRFRPRPRSYPSLFTRTGACAVWSRPCGTVHDGSSRRSCCWPWLSGSASY